MLDGFIKKFVLCQECGNPETVLVSRTTNTSPLFLSLKCLCLQRVTSKKLIESSCRACGYRCNLPLTHRLTTYIINNPPNGTAKGKGKGKKGKKDKDANKEDEKSSVTDSMQQGGSQTAQAQQREAGGRIDAPDAIGDDDDDDVFGDDATEEAARERAKELGGGVISLTQTDDLEKSMSERLEIFHKFVESRLKEPKFPAKEVISESERLECKDKGVMILVQSLWCQDTLQAMKKYQGLFQRVSLI